MSWNVRGLIYLCSVVYALSKWNIIATVINCSLLKMWRGHRNANMTGGGGATGKRMAVS